MRKDLENWISVVGSFVVLLVFVIMFAMGFIKLLLLLLQGF